MCVLMWILHVINGKVHLPLLFIRTGCVLHKVNFQHRSFSSSPKSFASKWSQILCRPLFWALLQILDSPKAKLKPSLFTSLPARRKKKTPTLKISGKILSLLHAHTGLGILGSAWTLLHSLGIREQIPQRAAPLLDTFGANRHTLACYLLLVMKRSCNKHQSNIVSLVSSGYE